MSNEVLTLRNTCPISYEKKSEINDFLEQVKYFIPPPQIEISHSLSEAFLPHTADNNSNPNGQKSNQLSFSHPRIIS